MAKNNIPSIIRRRYQKSKELMQPIFDSREINVNLYKGILNTHNNSDWDYSFVDPQVFPLVRNYLSRSNPAMSALRLEAVKQQDFETRKINQDLLNWQLNEIMATTLFYRMYFSAYLKGRGYAKTGWKYEKAINVQSQDEEGNVITTKVLRDIIDRPDAKFVRYNNILIPDRNNPELHTQSFVIELIQQRVGEMLDENERLEDAGEKPYWDKKFLTDLKKSGVVGKLLEYEMERATDADSKNDLAFKSAYIPMMCMHTLDGDVFYMPLEEEKIINNDTENRYWHGHYPYIDFCPFPEDDEYCNVALVDIVGDLQIAATEVLNQTLTNIRQINEDMWLAGSSASQTPDWQFRKRPGGVIRLAGDVGQIQQVRTQDNTRQSMAMNESLSTKFEKAGGIGSLYSSGVSATGGINQTARGAQIIDQNIDTNMKMIGELFGEQVLKRMGEHFLELNAQYITEEQTFAITGKKGVSELVTITPDQVTANFKVIVNSDKVQKQTPASIQASLQNSITVLQGIQAQSQGAVVLDVVPVVEALLQATPEMENIDGVIISIDEKSKRDIAMMERGQLPEIKIRDSHKDLIIAANVHFVENEMNYPEEVKQLFDQYFQKHMSYLQAAQQAQQMMQPPQPQPGQPMPGGDPAMENMGEQDGLPVQTYNLGSIA